MRYLILCLFIAGCATSVVKYEYVDGKAVPIERVTITGIGEAKVDKDSYSIESKPWIEVPSLPKLEFDQ